MLPPTVSLDDVLADAVGTVSVKGVVYDVLGLNAAEYQMIIALSAGKLTDEARVWTCIRRIVPSMQDDVFQTLTMKSCGAVLGVAQGFIRAVDDAIPNSSGPTTETPSPASESPAS